MEGIFRLRLLGPVQIERDGELVRGFRSRKALALLGYLALQDHPIPREHLVDLFWRDQSEARGRANLSWVLNRISTLLPDCLQADRHSVQFQRAAPSTSSGQAPSAGSGQAPYWLDIEAFEELEAQGDAASLAAAVELYRGELLEGLYLHGCAEFEIWLVGERERWRQRVAQVLEALVTHHSQRGEHQQSLRFAQRLLALEPWREETHRQVMRLLAYSDQRGAALVQYETCRRVLAEELGVEPTEETTALYERIQTADAARRHNLLAQPTPFVGREEELAEIGRLLDNPDCRLLTILGLGGVGKTRLALQAAADQTEAFLEGVFFVPLAPLSTTEHLTSAIAEAVGFSFAGQDAPKLQLLSYLRGKEMLLILDNFEHLLEEAVFVAEILRQAPEIKLLVTSRAKLNVEGEHLFPIAGMDFPESPPEAIADTTRYSAVELFLTSAQRVQPNFELTTDKLKDVVHICRLVEGLPLGILLAAAWVEMLSPREIAAEISQGLDFLETDLRDVPERQRSMRAVFDHSWRLLAEQDREVLRALSIFRGGFTREAAQQVTGASLRRLMGLVNKSLLHRAATSSTAPKAEGRYEMHELLRQYVAEKLTAIPEADAAARDRHCAFYVAFLGCWEADLVGARPVEALTAIRAEIANVRAAWHWAVKEARLKDIEQGLNGLSRYYLLTGPFQEGEMLIGRAVDCVRALVDRGEQAEREMGTVLSRLLAAQANLLNQQDMYEQAIAVAQAAIDQAQASQAISPEALGHLEWGRGLWSLGDYQAARSQFESALGLAQDTVTRAGVQPKSSAGSLPLAKVEALRNLGNVSVYQGDYARGRAYYEESLHTSREIGNRQGEASALNNLGLVAEREGDYADARICLEQALQIYRELGDRLGEGRALNNLGNVAESQGDFAKSEVYRKQALLIHRELGDRYGESIALEGLGIVSSNLVGNYARARVYHGQALQITREIGHRRMEGTQLHFLGCIASCQGDYAGAMTYHEQALQIHRELGNRRGESQVLTSLGLTCAHQGHGAQAEAYLEQALCICRELGERPQEGTVLFNLGYTLAESGRLAEAAKAYRQALALRRELGQSNLAMEPLAGLARVSLAQGNLPQAQTQVEEILTYLETNTPSTGPSASSGQGSGHGLEGTNEPFQVYLTCYRVLRANQDPRAQEILTIAYRLLQERAAKISDEKLRRSFLENVTAHREIVEEMQALE